MTKSSDKFVLHVSPRTVLGKKSKQLRAQGKIPANIFGLGQDSEAVMIDKKAFHQLVNSGHDAGLFYLKNEAEKKDIPVLMGDSDKNVVNGELLHVSFRRVSLKEKVVADVAIEVTGSTEVADANLLILKNEVSVKALPADLPESFIMDVSVLTQVGQQITLADLPIDSSKITFVLPEETKPEDVVLALLQEVKEEVEEVPAETAETPAGDAAQAEAPAEAGSDSKKEE